MLHVDRRRESERAADILARVGLAGTERKLAGSLPLGQMKRLEVARALAVDPKVILLDEPLAGPQPHRGVKQVETIAAVHSGGITVILVEHNLEEVMRICRRLIVLNNGLRDRRRRAARRSWPIRSCTRPMSAAEWRRMLQA